MVVCNYKEHDQTRVIYEYGNRESDITGLIALYLDGSGFEILKEPDNGIVYMRSLQRLYSRHWKDLACGLADGLIKEKISYEY